jgi:hypothetical protein
MSDTGEMLSEQTAGSSESPEARSIYEWVSDTAKANPALVVGGALAIGAVAAMVLVGRGPQSRARAVEKRIGRELRSLDRAIRRQRPISAASDRLADASASIASTLSAMDRGVLREVVNRASEFSSQVSRRFGL